MALFTPGDRRKAELVSGLVYCNPFRAERIELERGVLGEEFDEGRVDWNVHPDWEEVPGEDRLRAHAQELAERARKRLKDAPSPKDRDLYEEVVLFTLYHRHRSELEEAVRAQAQGKRPRLGAVWDAFLEEARHFFPAPHLEIDPAELAHVFACFVQICRAFQNIFNWIIGVSEPAVELRAAVWQSIFTHDMRRYRRLLFNRMGDYTTLISGPSGTGKELVARAVGLSRFIPFDPRTKELACETELPFHALNLSALSATLIESEMFGHTRGSFTGALGDRKGWLEICPELGSVFLDELGEVEPTIQVKLLRVLEDRKFSRVGDTRDLLFRGKLIAATNRDLAEEMHAGRFRTDLYYRLCADTILMPTLQNRIHNSPAERRHLVTFLARRLVGDESDSLAEEVETWIDNHLGPDYPWPGNVRELEQCVRNILIRREYHPARPQRSTDPTSPTDPHLQLAEDIRAQSLSAEDLLRRYCTLVYRSTGSYEQAARTLKLDRRTVKSKVE